MRRIALSLLAALLLAVPAWAQDSATAELWAAYQAQVVAAPKAAARQGGAASTAACRTYRDLGVALNCAGRSTP